MTERSALHASAVDTHLILNALNSMAASHARQGLPEDDTLFALSDYLLAILPHAKPKSLALNVQLTVLELQLALYAQVRGLTLRVSTHCAAELALQHLHLDLGILLTSLLDLLQPKQGGVWQVDIRASAAGANAASNRLELRILLTSINTDGQLPIQAAKTVLSAYAGSGAVVSAEITQRELRPTSYCIVLIAQSDC